MIAPIFCFSLRIRLNHFVFGLQMINCTILCERSLSFAGPLCRISKLQRIAPTLQALIFDGLCAPFILLLQTLILAYIIKKIGPLCAKILNVFRFA